MSGVDVRDLTNEKLPVGGFPAKSRADFRLHIAPQVHRGIEEHAKADTAVEICGVLVGSWGIDDDGPYATVTDYIRCQNAASKVAEVTFTHESWAQINKEMDSKYADARIVGWYHSHPDFGIFLSDRDCFIHEHFFSGPGQVAYVIDPVRDLEGVFAWRAGKPAPLPHYWIGERIRTVEASQRSIAADRSDRSPPPAGSSTSLYLENKPRQLSTLGFATMTLALLGAFTFGMLYGGWRSRWEQQMIVEGAVAHFANTKMIREGLETELAAVRARLGVLAEEMEKLPDPNAGLDPKEQAEAANRRAVIRDNLKLCESALGRIESHYGLSDVERAMLARIAAIKQAELRRAAEAAAPSNAPQRPAERTPRSNEPATGKTPAHSTGNTQAGAPDTPAANPPSRDP